LRAAGEERVLGQVALVRGEAEHQLPVLAASAQKDDVIAPTSVTTAVKFNPQRFEHSTLKLKGKYYFWK
jgi:hypothetical protein